MRRTPGRTFLAILLFAAPASCQTMAQLARELGRAAGEAGVRKLAVSRFEASESGTDAQGEHLDDSLTTALVREGHVDAVERRQLPRLAEEFSLDRTGLISDGETRELKLAAAEGLVVGRYQIEGRRMRLYARIVRLADGVIIGAGRADLALEPDDQGPQPDARLSPGPCFAAAERVRRLQSDVLDLKLRFWSIRMRLGEDLTQVTRNPGATIPDAAQRERFYEALHGRGQGAPVAPMTEDELRALRGAEDESDALIRDCGL